MGRLLLCLLLLVRSVSAAGLRKGEPPLVNRDVETTFRVAEGSKAVSLVCPLLSDPKSDGVIVHWLKDGEEIGNQWSQYKFVSNNRELVVKKPQRHDAGIFTCRAINGFGHAEVDFFLDVFDPLNDVPISKNEAIMYATKPSPPKWYNDGEEFREARNGPIYFNPGDKLELRCPATGNPLPEITWLKNGLVLDMGEVRRHNSAKFQLDDISRNDSGAYTCRLENRHGNIEETFIVIVGGSGADMKQIKNSFEQAAELDGEAWGGNTKNAPVIDEPQNATIFHGHTAKFTCHLTQPSSKLSFRWLKQTNKLASAMISIRNKTFIVLDQPENGTVVSTKANGVKVHSNTLVIKSASEADNGKYFCVITGADGYVGYRAAQLNVVHRTLDTATTDATIKIVILTVAAFFIVLVSIAVIWLKCYLSSSSKARANGKGTCNSSNSYLASSHGTGSAVTKKTIVPQMFGPSAPPPPPRIPIPEAPPMSVSPNKMSNFLPSHMNHTPTGSPLLYGGDRRTRTPHSATLDRRYRPHLHRSHVDEEMSRLSSNIYDSGSPLPPPPSHVEVPSSNSSHIYCTTSPKLSRFVRTVPEHAFDDNYLGNYGYREKQPFVNSSQRW